jgi:hypothetical protein
MPTVSSLLALALALSACSAQNTSPVKSCLGQTTGTPCEFEVRNSLAGIGIKVGVATGQCCRLSTVSPSNHHESLLVSSFQCIQYRVAWLSEQTIDDKLTGLYYLSISVRLELCKTSMVGSE